MDQVNLLIIGGGVVGCAIAESLSRLYNDVFLVEALPKFGMATSSRNSGVLHSGIYYERDSLKARLCVRGNALSKEFCLRHSVPLLPTGKLVVARNDSELPALLALKKKGEDNGVAGLTLLEPADILQREPHLRVAAALEVPSTAVCAAEELVHAFARIAESQGANLVTHAKVIRLEPSGNTVNATVRVGDEDQSSEEIISARCVINAAGLYADEVAQLLGPRSWKIFPVRGEYCEIRGPRASLLGRPVYPLPPADGLSLGLHFTKTVWGTLLVGPTAHYVEGKDNYERDRLSVDAFAADARSMLPDLDLSDLHLSYSGLRPRLAAPGHKGFLDFVIEPDREVPRVIHLVGMESPGLTAAPAIAEYVTGLVKQILQ